MTQRILKSSPGTLRLTVTDSSGAALDPDGNAVTLGVVRDSDGSAVVAPGTDAVRESQGVYRHTLAPQSLLGVLEAEWSFELSDEASTATTHAEVVGGHLFTVADLRAFHPSLANAVKYPPAAVEEAREQVTEEFEDVLDRSPVPRCRKQVLSGAGRPALLLDRPDLITVRSVRVYSDADTYTDFTEAELADLRFDPLGRVQRVSGAWFAHGSGNVEVVYEYGMQSVPVGMRRLAMQRAKFILMQERTGGVTEPRPSEDGAAQPGSLGSYAGVRKVLEESAWSMRIPGIA